MIKVSKAARGIAFGDVSNSSVRNILSEISVRVYGKVTSQDLEDSLDYFGWKCPYTGEDLRERIEQSKGGYATDHIVPQNKEECGLNIRGNLVIVDANANSKKGNKTVEEFLLNDTEALGDFIKTPIHVRQERLKKNKRLSKKYGYDSESIKNSISKLMKDYYDELRVEQEKKIDEAIKIAGLSIITPISKNEEVVSNSTKIKTVLEMIPSNEDDFKKQLISKGHAKVTLEYNDGSVRYRDWNCSNITMDSNIRSNIQSTTYWRKRISEGLVKVTVEIK